MTGRLPFLGPAFGGGVLALGAAGLFGASTPLVQHAGAGVGAFATAALLYAGAALVGALLRRPVEREAALRRHDVPQLVAMAFFGAVLGPVALAWGLQRSGGTSASLMLSLESVFTALLAWVVYREVMDRRVWAAVALLVAGSAVLVVERRGGGGQAGPGLIAVGVATAAWGVDNTLSRGLADRDPGQVVGAKSLLGALATGGLAALDGDALPAPGAALALLAIGALGYGLSLRLYLLAQRAFGAARTGSVFAFAPFIGAGLAVVLGDRSPTPGVAVGGVLMLAGVALHLMESHGHEHVHEALDHEHAHRHDDGHHDHAHDPAHDHPHDPAHDTVHAALPTGVHSHPHRHAPTRHAHAHVPDAHHGHRH